MTEIRHSESLRRFCLAHDDASLVPAEAVGPSGLAPDWARTLVDAGRLTAAQAACLSEGIARAWQRSADLYARAPGEWFPPRRINLLIAAHEDRITPYLEPFAATSSLLYVSDLDADPEYVAYLLVHMERLSLVRSVRPALITNLSYWFDRSADERKAFSVGALRARRPDAAAFVAIADALTWIDELLHNPLRPPASAPTEPYIGVEGTALYLPKRRQDALIDLGNAVDAALRSAMTRAPTVVPARNETLDSLCEWLVDVSAQVVVIGPDGRVLWSADSGNPVPLRRALAEVDDAVVASIRDDLRVIDARSRSFLERVADADRLPKRCAVLESGGGVYVDAGRRSIVYELQQPGFDARAIPAPPYHRLLLGARVVHEWGHVAHTAKIIRIPDERRSEYTEARRALGEQFVEVLGEAPEHLRPSIDEELAQISAGASDVPTALARKTLARVGDYLANLLSSKLIPAEEMQAYVRTNVRHHMDEDLGIVAELARYAYEIHYLALADLPRDYFFETSRFRPFFLDTGIVSEESIHRLFDAVGRVLDCYSIDETQIAIAQK